MKCPLCKGRLMVTRTIQLLTCIIRIRKCATCSNIVYSREILERSAPDKGSPNER